MIVKDFTTETFKFSVPTAIFIKFSKMNEFVFYLSALSDSRNSSVGGDVDWDLH